MKLVTFEAGDTDYKIWQRGCADLSPEDLDRGVKNARDFKGNWFALNHFRALCKRDEVLAGLPSAKQAYYEACLAKSPKHAQQYSHPIVFYAGAATGWHELSCMTESEIFPRYESNFLLLVRKLRDGEDITMKIPEALPRKSVVFTEEQRQRNINNMEKLKQQVFGDDMH